MSAAAMATVVRAWWRRPFAWGTADCATFAAQCVHAVTGRHPLAGLTWANKRQAFAVLQRLGGLRAATSSVLGTPQPTSAAMPRLGDVGLHTGQGGPALCVWCGARWMAPHRTGLVAVQPAEFWSVTHA
jgi:hypothetical protein